MWWVDKGVRSRLSGRERRDSSVGCEDKGRWRHTCIARRSIGFRDKIE
jgi:hypothetical protein